MIHNPVEEQQIIPDMQEPIISEEEFERVQEPKPAGQACLQVCFTARTAAQNFISVRRKA